MANSKSTQKVTRGTKEAITPGETKQEPIADVISREITKIVESIDFDTKFETINTAIDLCKPEMISPILQKISDKMNPIIGALYGVSQVDDNTNPSSLLGKLGHLDQKLSLCGPMSATLTSIYDLIDEEIDNKPKYNLEDLAIALSNDIKESLKKLNNRSLVSSIADKIIISINENANSLIARAGEVGTNITNNIKLLGENLGIRTAQILDAINAITKSSKDQSTVKGETSEKTKILNYDIFIEAKGLDNETVQSLIDLSKINVDNVDYLANLNDLLEYLSKFEKLNNVELNGNIKSIVDSINQLSSLYINPDVFKESVINEINNFITTLGNIEFSKLNSFDKNIFKSFGLIGEAMNNFGKVDVKNLMHNLNRLDSKLFAELINNLKDIKVSKEDADSIQSLSELFEGINSITDMNSGRFEDLSSNLRKMIKLTEKPTVFTKMKLSSRGLIHILMHNLSELAAGLKNTKDNTESIIEMINLISNIAKTDPGSFETLLDKSELLVTITDKEEPYLYKAFQNIEELGKLISNWDGKNSYSSMIGTELKKINSISKTLDFKDLIMFYVKVETLNSIIPELTNTFTLIKPLFESTKEIADVSKTVEGNVDSINSALDIITTLKADNLSYLKNVMILILDISKYFKEFASIKDKNLDISTNIAIINNCITQINQLPSLNNTDSLRDLPDLMDVLLVIFGYFTEFANIEQEEIDISNNVAIVNSAIGQLNELQPLNNADNLTLLSHAMYSLLMGADYLTTFANIPSDNLDISENIKLLQKAITQINEISPINNLDTLESVKNGIKSISNLNKALTIIGMTSPLAMVGLNALEVELTLLGKVIGSMNKNIPKINDDVLKSLKEFSVIVLITSGILLFGALVGGFVITHLKEILGFTLTLGLFILATIGAFNLATRGMKEAKLNATQFGLLLAISAGIMLIGGLVMTMYLPLVLGSLAFAVTLGVFVLAVTWAYNFGTKDLKETTMSATLFLTLVGISTLALLLGGYFIFANPWMIATTILFGAILTAFVFGVIWAYKFGTKGLETATISALLFVSLVGISALALLIGGYFFMEKPALILFSLLFGAILAAFVLAVTFAFSIGAKQMKKVEMEAMLFLTIVGISTVVLLLGGYLLMTFPNLWEYVATFGAILAAFVLAVTFAFSIGAKQLKRAKMEAMLFMGVVVIASAVLLLGGYLIYAYPGLDIAVLTFCGLAALFITEFGVAIWLLGKIKKKDLLAGELALAGIVVIVGLLALAFKEVAKAMLVMQTVQNPWEQFGLMSALLGEMAVFVIGLGALSLNPEFALALAVGEGLLLGIIGIIAVAALAYKELAKAFIIMSVIKNPWEQFGLFSAIIGETAVFVIGLGALSLNPIFMAALAVGEVLLAGIMGIIILAGKAMQELAIGMISLETVKGFKSDQIIEALKQFMNIIPELEPLASIKLAIKMKIINSSVSSLSETIMHIATAVKQVCDLKTEDGRNLTTEDFTLAATNVNSVVTILGNSLIDLYDNDTKGIFTSGNTLTDLLGMDTKFSRVAKSCSTLGQMIANIAKGVKDFADLKVPMYDAEGKEKGYRSLTQNDFKSAANSVKTVITTLAYALIDVYNGNEDLFKWELIGDNPFAMVSKSCGQMGQMISDISKGIKDYAELRIPIYDKDGKEIGSRQMTEEDFINASNNINTVITTIAKKLIEIYEEPGNAYMFTDPSAWHTSADKSPMGMITKALGGVGTLVKDAALGIKEIAGLQVDWGDILGTKEKPGKVENIITCLAASIYKAYNEHQEIFTDASFWHTTPSKTPFGMVTQCLNNVIPFIKEVSTSMKEINDLPFSAADVSENGELYKKSKGLIETLPKAVINLIQSTDGKTTIYGKFLKNEDSLEILGNMLNIYKQINSLVEESGETFKTLVGYNYTGDIITKQGKIVYSMLSTLPSKVNNILISKTLKDFWGKSKDIIKVNGVFGEINKLIESVLTGYSTLKDGLIKSQLNPASIWGCGNNFGKMLSTLPSQIMADLLIHEEFYKTKQNDIDIMTSSFTKINELVKSIILSYISLSNGLSKLGITGSDTNVIDSLTTNLKTLVSKMVNSINELNASINDNAIVKFIQNVTSYSAALATLITTYSMVPSDLTVYENVVKAIEGVNLKIAEIPNLDNFEQEQKLLEKYVKTLNSLKLQNVASLFALMSVMNALASKLGSIDKFTEVLDKKLSTTLTKLAQEIRLSGDIINKADEIQKRRHEAIKSSIRDIQQVMNEKLLIEVTHKAETPETPSDSGFSDSISSPALPSSTGDSSITNNTYNTSNTTTQTTKSGNGEGNYPGLREIIKEAINASQVNQKLDNKPIQNG